MSKEVNDTVPDAETLNATFKEEIFDEKGAKITFGSVVSEESPTMVIFIRHFFCGMCQSYVAQFSQVPKEAFDKAGVKIIVVGCGEWQLIENYRKNTNFQHPIYANPSRALYRTLGMSLETLRGTPASEKKKSYVQGVLSVTVKSILNVRNPLHVGKQGNLFQLGGEFIFGPGHTCTFAHRMAHTEDHVEADEFLKEGGVSYKAA